MTKKWLINHPWVILSLLVTMACGEKVPEKHFTILSSEESGVGFTNTISSTDSLNILNYIYFYDGGGVGIGDINNDGLEDIFFTGNQVSSKLYLNLGDLKFRDITQQAGVTTDRWCTGVSFIDINTDGYLDIYVNVAGSLNPLSRANLLFINNSDQTFTESAEEYRIADTSFSTHSAFVDYDLDGDLDLYLLNHANERAALNTPLPKKLKGEGASTDRLYRNNGDLTFSDVSSEAGITIEGYGLGVAVSDLNQDGWPDLYISNDFITNDILYSNNGNGTFTNMIEEAVREQTYNGMGNDVGDFNNDGLPDVVVMDMLSPDPVREKTMAGSMTYDKFNAIKSMDYEPQFMRNTLQLNQRGMHFTEIGRYAGIHRTDWSWAPLLADFDNDGWKDLFITNGYLKDITNKDFIDYNTNLSMFKSKVETNKETLLRIEGLNGIELPNYIFKNDTDLTFSDQTLNWGLNTPSYSYGAAYSDLDNDGDLDLIVNNLNGPVFIIRNNKGSIQNYIQVDLKGPESNPMGLGAKVQLRAGGIKQTVEKHTTRGFKSSVSNVLHFGLGSDTIVQSLRVIWPDGKYQELTDLPNNQRIEISHNNDLEKFSPEPDREENLFKEVTGQFGLDFTHQQDDYPDFKFQPLLPYKLSGKGPALAVGDLDGNGLEDLFVGGSWNYTGYVLFQRKGGVFQKAEVKGSRACDVYDALIFDANDDGYDDLYLVCGGIISPQGSNTYNDRLFLGTKDDSLQPAENWLPAINTSSFCVDAGDFDGDGDLDLFVGGYAEPQNYPAIPPSYLLRNEGNEFVEVTEQVAPGLKYSGMVRSAVWADYNNDGQQDLIIVGEWMPIRVFQNNDGQLEEMTADFGLEEQTGWWQSITSGDFDNDGDIDFICGNVGMNSPYQVSENEPVRLYAAHLNGDGRFDPIMTYYVGGNEVIHASRETLLGQQPFLNRLFPDHLSYATASIRDIIPEGEFSKALILESKTFESVILDNIGGKSFQTKKLPAEAQLFPLKATIVGNFDGDDLTDLIASGGFSNAEFDGESHGASNTILLTKDSEDFLVTKGLPFFNIGDVSSMVLLTRERGEKLVIMGINSSKMRVFEF